MARNAEIEPRWLVSLMCQWVRRQNALEDGALGYPAKSSFLTIGVQRSDRIDPTEFCARDFDELEAALRELLNTKPDQWAAMMMYYRPWSINALKGEGWPFGNSTYYQRLHSGHKRISTMLVENKLKAA